MECDTLPSHDASTHQIWDSDLKDMHWTQSRTDGLTDGQCDYYMPPKVPLGHIIGLFSIIFVLTTSLIINLPLHLQKRLN